MNKSRTEPLYSYVCTTKQKMKSRMLLSPLRNIGSWKKLFLCGKKSLEKPTVELPHDIIESEILPKLPAESLGRFMCVCKQWKSFISTPEFARKNLQQLTNSQSLTHHRLLDYRDLFSLKTIDCEDLKKPSVTPLFVPRLNGALQVSPIASLDGLVFVELPDTSEFAFWNPLTGAYKKFKANSPCYYTMFYAFYFDSSNNDYKVLQVTSHSGLNACIYSQRFNSWKKIQFLETHQYLSHTCRLHWSKPTFLSHHIYFMVGNFNVVLIIVFDVKSEKFREIRLPILNTSYAPYKSSLVVLKGCIHYSVAYSNTSDITSIMNCELWRMDGDGDSWTKLTTVSQKQPDHKLIAYPTRNANWLGIWKEDGVFHTIDMQDLARNFVTNYFIDTELMLYIQTLVSPSA